MGLDAVAHSNATILHTNRTPTDEERDAADLVCSIWYREFMQAVAGLGLATPPPGSFGHIIFRVDERHWRKQTRASLGYVGYYHFRQQLARVSGLDHMEDLEPGQPFWELCWMSDTDGFFSTDAARLIATQFDDHRDAFAALKPGVPMLVAYDNWASVFRFAADHAGIVEYH